MPRRAPGIRYPKKLMDIDEAYYTAEVMAAKLDVSDRTVYRWYSQGYLQRDIDNGVTTYAKNGKVTPKVVVTTSKSVKATNKYTKAELDWLYQEVMDGKRDIKIDISHYIKSGANHETLVAILGALEEFHEFVSYVIKRNN